MHNGNKDRSFLLFFVARLLYIKTLCAKILIYLSIIKIFDLSLLLLNLHDYLYNIVHY